MRIVFEGADGGSPTARFSHRGLTEEQVPGGLASGVPRLGDEMSSGRISSGCPESCFTRGMIGFTGSRQFP